MDPILVAVPASTAVAKFLDEHDSSDDGSTAFITHLDRTEVPFKMIYFWAFTLTTAFSLALPAWCIYSSRSTLYYCFYIFVDQFIRLPIPRSIGWWDMLKAIFVYCWVKINWLTWLYHGTNYIIPRLLWYRFRPAEVICRAGKFPVANVAELFQFAASVNDATHPLLLTNRISLSTATPHWAVQPLPSFRITELVWTGKVPMTECMTTLWYRDSQRQWVGFQLWKAAAVYRGGEYRPLHAAHFLVNYHGLYKLLQ